MNTANTIFTDGLLEANIINGVARLTLGQTGSDGKLHPSGQIALPLMQLPHLANALANLLRQVEARVKENQAKNDGQPTTEPALPSTFNFGRS